MTVNIEVSVGELIDKLTILEIKSARIHEVKKLLNIQRELSALNASLLSNESLVNYARLPLIRTNLKRVNEKLWDIEDAIRAKERSKVFDAEFIELARSVYIVNDERSRLKREIDELTGSQITEEKSYQPY